MDFKLTNNPEVDVPKLLKLDKTTLLSLCETDRYVRDLCNNDIDLYEKITSPSD
jgi:hypothetical protein